METLAQECLPAKLGQASLSVGIYTTGTLGQWQVVFKTPDKYWQYHAVEGLPEFTIDTPQDEHGDFHAVLCQDLQTYVSGLPENQRTAADAFLRNAIDNVKYEYDQRLARQRYLAQVGLA